jgi:transcriptional regulator with GAF, ATPase, and Fis domain/pSer/pThr/pTyr-binding forkhead associated (FHA) protein
MVAYLVIREGSKWTDVFRLVPGQSVTIGRAPTNQIVIKDDRCSRCHAEVFQSEGQWTLRDHDSRNGTLVGDKKLEGDHPLRPGEIIRIGRSHLAFVEDLSTAFAELTAPPDNGRASDDTEFSESADAESSPDVGGFDGPEPTIVHRRGQTKLLTDEDLAEGGSSTLGRAAARLCRLAFEMAKAPDATSLADVALTGLFDSAQIDAGAVLLTPREHAGDPADAELEIVASRSDTKFPYHRVSKVLAATVLREGEAVLARNVIGDSTVSSRDSKGEIHATSVICAPVRRGKRFFGLLHLYSTTPSRVPDPDDLEFTLAVADTLAVALGNLGRRQELAENLSQIRNENQQLRERLGVHSELVGISPVVSKITEEIGRVAPTNATVLIRGESGVGKELVARAVHYSSPRKKEVFVCLNCAALSETLLESELFGHERGAFTGATERKIGKFEAAHRGTLMLDEIGEMSPTIQAKFLRVLEGHPFERVGGSLPVKVDVRVIAATNRDLEKDVAAGRFRRDLYFRLHVMEIFVPALRKRPEDIPELAAHFLKKINGETGRKIRGFTPEAMEQLMRYRWPGNVRDGAGRRRIHRPAAPDALQAANGRRHQRAAQPARRLHPHVVGRHGAAIDPDHAAGDRLEQKPDRQHPGHRAFHPRPQNPPLRNPRRVSAEKPGGRVTVRSTTIPF